MKVLILGGDGMLGHQLLNIFKNIMKYDAHYVRTYLTHEQYGLYDEINSYAKVDVMSFERVKKKLCSILCQRP